MALQRDTHYPGRWTTANAAHPQGAFKNRTAPGSLDGSYIEQDWANDWDGYFSALLNAASITPNGNVDTATSSQYFTALQAMLSQTGHGQCRLSVSSTTTLLLLPYNGRNVIVNGTALVLPTIGVTYTISGLAASTLYYVYLSGTTAAPVLTVSATAYVSGTNGVTVKSGDATQTLVGMVRTNASTQFVDSQAIRTCLNWFNRRKIVSNGNATGPFSFTSTTTIETSTTLRAQFLVWADDIPVAQLTGTFTQTSGSPGATQLVYQLFYDGLVTGYSPILFNVISPTWNMVMSAHGALGGIPEGYHYITLGTNVGTPGGTLSISNVQNTVSIFG